MMNANAEFNATTGQVYQKTNKMTTNERETVLKEVGLEGKEQIP